MFKELSASSHKYNTAIYVVEFQKLLGKIILCYKIMLSDKIQLENDENKIRDKLILNYLNNKKIKEKIKLNDFLFNREVPEDNTAGRTDIKVQTKNSFSDPDAYYIIECKRLDSENLKGSSGLNAEYAKEGILRFTSGYYSSYYRVNGMIGFVVEKMDIHGNINNINYIIKQHYPRTNTIEFLQKEKFIDNYDFHYSSKHKVNDNKEIILYHLMLDFTKNIVLVKK